MADLDEFGRKRRSSPRGRRDDDRYEQDRHDSRHHRRRDSDDSDRYDSDEGKKQSKSKSKRRDDHRDEDRQRSQELERKRKKEEKKLEKLYETPEEKRRRRMAKKVAKAQRRRDGTMAMVDQVGADDAEKAGKFVWHKKVESAKEQGISRDELILMERERAKDNKRELEAVKRRREERELEMQQKDQERDAMLRDNDSEQFRDWVQGEDKFQLEQAKLRSEIRLKEGRAQPIDLLARYLHTSKDDVAFEMNEPYTLFRGMDLDACEDLRADIHIYTRMEEGNAEHLDFWEHILVICQHEIAEHKRRRALRNRDLTPAERRALDTGINARVKKDIVQLFHGKSTKELEVLQKSIQRKLLGGGALDTGYWETLLKELKVHTSKATLKERHQALLRYKLSVLRDQQSQPTGGDMGPPSMPTDVGSGRCSPTPQPLGEELGVEMINQAEADALLKKMRTAVSDGAGRGDWRRRLTC